MTYNVACGLTACTPGSAPGPTLVNEYRTTFYEPPSCKRVSPDHLFWRYGVNTDGYLCSGLTLGLANLSRYITNHPGKLSLTIPSWVAQRALPMVFRPLPGEFCVTIALLPRLMAYLPRWLKVLAVTAQADVGGMLVSLTLAGSKNRKGDELQGIGRLSMPTLIRYSVLFNSMLF